MSEIILEPIEENNAEPTATAPEVTEPVEDAAPIEESVVQPAPAEPIEEVPVKRPRGRPKGSAKPKAKQEAKQPKAVPPPPKLKRETTTRRAPQPEQYSDSSTDEDEMVGRLMEDDMETQILQFLSARKRDQETKRRALWQNLASSGLRRQKQGKVKLV